MEVRPARRGLCPSDIALLLEIYRSAKRVEAAFPQVHIAGNAARRLIAAFDMPIEEEPPLAAMRVRGRA
ncbi:hypothetical protein [Pararhizobium haloflavum]|uniref:hypothetical protein n=1 Tax=Pararhizobium haloflavum TaxID=2037914 RepID=UPI0012FFDC4B|nr:hypothetical protein [Pararhizobium haloflavum]